ncbi:aminodeoxychorismate synthase component I [Agromyces badenianii]|uniref:aminodeoxychorismate synthase component I n=1 Tax=Agromyces badenianii TaxID=2080742 RepID=UPI000D591AFD|nr:aminodeoxychorismate synthase component I [Agromyces badenianii]PWC04372.1 aminodeoxychorismate synthase component I [Agromyces badenianii]
MPRRIRSLALASWRDPAQVFSAFAAGADTAVWLDGGHGAVAGSSVIAWAHADSTVLAGDAQPDTVYAELADELGGDVVDARADVASPSRLGWIGWFGYEFGTRTAGLPFARAETPDAAFLFADRAIVFDHAGGRVRLEWLESADSTAGETWALELAAAIALLPAEATTEPESPRFEASTRPASRWRHAAAEYTRMIAACQAAITRGDAYQLCLTNRIDVDVRPDPLETYLRLRRTSPSHHGGYLRFGDIALLSASPEQFLLVEPGGLVSTKPMKGTRPRSADPVADEALRRELLESEKERAENLMIVDLMRNDLGRIAALGTVEVPSLLEVEEYAHVHQLVSTVTAQLRHPLTALDVIEAAFPAGSMTGAPKRSAMSILHELEQGPRGIYSGAFGYLGVDGSADLAMVIRSIVLTPRGGSVGTGGGITALSVAAEEVEETRVKARALLDVLGAEMPASE